jgi:multidrug transporter EmrE-like cation transporter
MVVGCSGTLAGVPSRGWAAGGESEIAGLTLGSGLGLLCAVASALGTNLSFLFKHRGAVAAEDVDVRRPLHSAVELFRSKWWTIGWSIAVLGFVAHAAALALLPLSLAQAVLSGGFVLLAVLAERYFGFSLGRRQWVGVTLVAVALALLGVTGHAHKGSSADYSTAALILFEGAAVGLGVAFTFSHRFERIRAQNGVMLGAAAGLGFGVSDVAIKAISGDVGGSLHWVALAIAAAIFSFFASARSLQVGEGVAVIAVTSVAANMSAILAGVLVFGDPMGRDSLEVAARSAGFVLVLAGAVLMPAPVRAAGAVSGGPTEGDVAPAGT